MIEGLGQDFVPVCYVAYDSAGIIYAAGKVQVEMLFHLYLPLGCAIMEIPDALFQSVQSAPDQWRVLDGEVTEKLPGEMALSRATMRADGSDIVCLTGLPPGCTITVRQAGVTRTGQPLGSSAEFRTTTPGTIEITVASVSHKTWKGAIHAV